MNIGLGLWFALDLGGLFGLRFLLGGIGGSGFGFGLRSFPGGSGGIDFETLIDSRFMVWIGLDLGGKFGVDSTFGFDDTLGFGGIFGFDGTLGLCGGLDSLNFSPLEVKSTSKITGKMFALCTKTL